VIGAVSQPYIGELFLGIHGSGISRAHLNDKPIQCRPCKSLDQAILSTTGVNFLSPLEQDAFKILERSAPITRYGFDCYAYAVLAAGMIDLVVEAGLETYDVQALIPLIRGAGGVITGWRGDDAQSGGRVIAAGDADLHHLVLDHLRDVPNNPS
jgi:myo-inositol-1(or 4)-monophosphatase